MYKSKEEGGLGVGNIEDYNKAMLAKWIWRFKTEEGSLWARIIDSIHGVNWFSNPETMTNSYSCVWKDIVQGSVDIEDEGKKVINLIKAKLGNGENLHF